MREILGWICCGISALCLLGILGLSVLSPPDMSKPLATREIEQNMKVVTNPIGCLLILFGTVFGVLGMWLIGMFGG